MRGGVRGFDAAALVDRDVDEHGALLHLRKHVLGDEERRLGARQQDGTDDEVGSEDLLLDVVLARVQGADLGAPDLAHAHRHVGSIRTNNTAAEHDDLGGMRPGDATHEDATPAERLLQVRRTDLSGHPTGDLGHGGQKRQGVVRQFDRLICDADGL